MICIFVIPRAQNISFLCKTGYRKSKLLFYIYYMFMYQLVPSMYLWFQFNSANFSDSKSQYSRGIMKRPNQRSFVYCIVIHLTMTRTDLSRRYILSDCLFPCLIRGGVVIYSFLPSNLKVDSNWLIVLLLLLFLLYGDKFQDCSCKIDMA